MLCGKRQRSSVHYLWILLLLHLAAHGVESGRLHRLRRGQQTTSGEQQKVHISLGAFFGVAAAREAIGCCRAINARVPAPSWLSKPTHSSINLDSTAAQMTPHSKERRRGGVQAELEEDDRGWL
ncbi:hypothetical protein MTO96_051576 [Rhipicephalus appendiculatus]